MTINPQVRYIITNYIDKFFTKGKPASVIELIRNFDGPSAILESEVHLIINQLISDGYLQVINNDSSDTKLLNLVKPSTKPLEQTQAIMVTSRPRFTELGFNSIEKRNLFMETTYCFKILINSAKKILRICSPFLQRDILYPDAFPALRQLLLDAIERGVEIKILTREIIARRLTQISWLRDFNLDVHKPKLSIADYHLIRGNGILSSTHAKIICADHDSAYVGSAELRRNSIVANFEIGCYLRGPQVYGICESFDLMFDKGQKWKL
jgi:PLD-like domain